MDEKTPIQPTSTMKSHFITGSIAAGIILVVLFLFWFTFKVIPAVFSNGSNFVATSLSSTFIPNEETKTAAPETITETKTTSAPSTTETTETKTTKTETSNAKPVYVAPAANYYGKSDLSVRLISTGIIDPATKRFFATSYAGANDTIAIKFEVRNIGTNVTGPWNLRLNMPSQTTPYFDSGSQVSIKPGDRIEYVGSFDRPNAQGINLGYITADPMNLVNETVESNNALTVPLRVDGTTYNYGNNYNYGSTVTYGAPLPYGTLYTWTNISAECYANPQMSYVGNQVTWFATASGGNGYYTYTWNGTNELYGTSNAVNKIYYTAGQKVASVTVTSNGQSVTKVCSMNVF